MSIQGIPQFDRIVADSDFDGLCGAAILKKYNQEAEVIFSHAALIRNGNMDDVINSKTVIVDLPFHENSGWYVDHHQTNKPSSKQLLEFEKKGGVTDWQPTPSAARLAYEIIKPYSDLSNFVDLMPFVDALDSGGISIEQFREDGKLMRFSRTLSKVDADYMLDLVDKLANGYSIEEILQLPEVSKRIAEQKESRKELQRIVLENTQVIDRLAICNLQETGYFSNGYLVTATFGDKADACCIIHGYNDGEISNPNRPPLSASFYANSFIENGQGKYDLSRLATRFDESGGGHMNACGCRIQAQGLEHNLAEWIDMWQRRNTVLKVD
jgi:oligoribonuclease NrnB/cAMP/cGMP phosphodiesterase (DHH superfamily)